MTEDLHPPGPAFPHLKGEPIQQIVDRLRGKGVHFLGPIVNDAGAGSFADFEDPDG